MLGNLARPSAKFEKRLNMSVIECKVVLTRLNLNSKCQNSDGEANPPAERKDDSSNKKQLSLNGCMASSLILQNAKVSETASNGLCQFDCLECHESFFMWRNLHNHAQKEHSTCLVKANFENYLYKAVVHVCKICSQRVLCDYTFLTAHMRWKHHLSIIEYRKNYDFSISQTAEQANLQKLLEKSEISEKIIGNLCTFRCTGCKRMYKSIQAFTKHTNSRSFTCPLKGQNLKWQTSLEKVIAHRCELCSKLILCDTRMIKSHMVGAHGIKTIGKYAKPTGSTLKPPDSPDPAPFFTSITQHESVLTLQDIGNHCTFRCSKCGHVSSQWTHMTMHLKKTGHGPWTNMWHRYISKIVRHECKICKRKILNDCEFLAFHVRSYHRLTLSDYSAKLD